MNIEPNEQVMFRRLGDRMVLIHLQTNDIFDLNETSARLWELIVEHGDLEMIQRSLSSEYDVEVDQLQHETRQTLATFAEHGLIRGYDGN